MFLGWQLLVFACGTCDNLCIFSGNEARTTQSYGKIYVFIVVLVAGILELSEPKVSFEQTKKEMLEKKIMLGGNI